MFVRLPNIPNVAQSLPVGSRLNLFLGTWEALGAFTLGSTNVEGGLHSPFLVKTKLDRVTKNPSAYGQDAVEPVQNLWGSSADLSWFPKLYSRWRHILDLNKPNLSRPSGPPSNKWSGLPQ